MKAQLVNGTLAVEWAVFLDHILDLAVSDHARHARRRSGVQLVMLYATGPSRPIHEKLASGVYNLARRELEARDRK